jgi:hypothetical protein
MTRTPGPSVRHRMPGCMICGTFTRPCFCLLA